MRRLPCILAAATASVAGLLIWFLYDRSTLKVLDVGALHKADLAQPLLLIRFVQSMGAAITVGAFTWSILYLLLGPGGMLGLLISSQSCAAELQAEQLDVSAHDPDHSIEASSSSVEPLPIKTTMLVPFFPYERAHSGLAVGSEPVPPVGRKPVTMLRSLAAIRFNAMSEGRETVALADTGNVDIVPSIHLPRMPDRPEPRAALESLLDRLEQVASLRLMNERRQTSG